MCVGGGGGEGAGCVVQISSISLHKISRLRGVGGGGQGRGCFARKPSFTLTLSDSILLNLIPKQKTRKNHTIFGVSCSRKDIFINFPIG